uniref:Ptk1 n=1 Tax=Arundo donax TaxID=35708 RepID=A0A0A9A195_ARUDO
MLSKGFPLQWEGVHGTYKVVTHHISQAPHER